MASAISFGRANSGFQAATINGPVNTEFHHHTLPERPETPPNPSIIIPFSRDADFVERGTILEQISQKCDVLGSRTALIGLGGVGKSQLAIEYAYRTKDGSPRTWVFWVHASNAARFEQSFRDIADHVKILGRRNPTANIFQLVYDWLRDDRKGRWVLILDNVDDAGFLIDSGQTNRIGSGNSRPLVEYIPRCANGSILITTRSESAALKLVEKRDIIEVEQMDRADALALFKNKLGRHDDSDDTAELATALEFMPLAIVQAAAYISQREPRCSVRQYLQDFQKSDYEKISLLDNEAGHLRRDKEAKNSIIITWHVSFTHVRHIRPSAAGLLALMSLCDRQGIPESLLRSKVEVKSSVQKKRFQRIQWLALLLHRNGDRYRNEKRSSKSNERIDGFEDDILMLRNYSFISISKSNSTFEMHALVQLAMRTWLEANGQLELWRRHFYKILCTEFPSGEYENWAKCQELFPHAQSTVAHEPANQEALKDWAAIQYKAGWYAWRIGNTSEAEKLVQSSLLIRRRIFGQEYDDTIWSMMLLGYVYKDGRRWKESELLDKQVMEIIKMKFGADHPQMIKSIGNLAVTYHAQGQWDAAEELKVQVMEASKTKLGANHPDTLTSKANLALTYQAQGRWDAAEELEVQVLEACKTKLGADHPNTLKSMVNLASTYRNQGRWNAAEELEVQVIEARKTKFGADHPFTLISMGGLALTYRAQGRWDAAEELGVQVMETSKIKLGADHLNTLTSMVNLALTYQAQGRWDSAEELEVQVVEARKTKLGADHPDTLNSMVNLASTYRNQGRWNTAEELEVQVIEARKTKLGADHLDTLISMANLASIYHAQGRWDAAEELRVQVMETHKTKLGADHTFTLTSMGNLALTYHAKGQLDDAEKLEVLVMEARKTKLGADHPEMLISMASLASTYHAQGRWDAAEELRVQVMEARKTKLGADHPSTLTSMGNLALTYYAQGRWDAAEKLEVQVMEAHKTKLGADHPDTLGSMKNLAFTWKRTGRKIEAIRLMEECIHSQKLVLGPNHPHTLSSCTALVKWKAEQEVIADSIDT